MRLSIPPIEVTHEGQLLCLWSPFPVRNAAGETPTAEAEATVAGREVQKSPIDLLQFTETALEVDKP